MDPQTDLPDLVEDLEVNIDELSDILSPLLTTPLSTTASSLPLLDKAKLYVLAAYSIESLLYSTLQASGVNAKEHAIFKELGRLKGYFGKIKSVEERPMGPSAPKSKLDVGAAARFIKHGLAGNAKYDLERAERLAKEKARAHLKTQQMVNKKFDDSGSETPKAATPKKRGADEMQVADPQPNYNDGEEVLEGLEEAETEAPVKQSASKRQRMSVAAQPMDVDSTPSQSQSEETDGKKKKKSDKKKDKKKKKKTRSAEAENAEAEDDVEPAVAEEIPEVTPEEPQPESEPNTTKKKRTKKASKSADVSEAEAPEPTQDPEPPASPPKKTTHRSARKTRSTAETTEESPEEEEEAQETILPARTPKTRSETFNALLDGSLPEKQKRGRGRPPKAKK